MWLSSAPCFRFRLQMKRRMGETHCQFPPLNGRDSKSGRWTSSVANGSDGSGRARVSASGLSRSLHLIHCHSLTPIGHTKATQSSCWGLQAVKRDKTATRERKRDNYVFDDSVSFSFPFDCVISFDPIIRPPNRGSDPPANSSDLASHLPQNIRRQADRCSLKSIPEHFFLSVIGWKQSKDSVGNLSLESILATRRQHDDARTCIMDTGKTTVHDLFH